MSRPQRDVLTTRRQGLLVTTGQPSSVAAVTRSQKIEFFFPAAPPCSRPLAAPPSFLRAPRLVVIAVATIAARSSMMAVVLTLLIMMGMLMLMAVAMLAMLISMTIRRVVRPSWRRRASGALRSERAR